MTLAYKCDIASPVNEPLRPRMRVYVVSGKSIGAIADVATDRFQLESADGPLWISNDAVFTVEQGRVTLICALGGLKRYEVDPPMA